MSGNYPVDELCSEVSLTFWSYFMVSPQQQLIVPASLFVYESSTPMQYNYSYIAFKAPVYCGSIDRIFEVVVFSIRDLKSTHTKSVIKLRGESNFV